MLTRLAIAAIALLAIAPNRGNAALLAIGYTLASVFNHLLYGA